MVPLVLLVHPDPPWSTFSVKFQKVWIRMDRSGPGGLWRPQPPLVDQERSGPPWTMLRHFPDAPPSGLIPLLSYSNHSLSWPAPYCHFAFLMASPQSNPSLTLSRRIALSRQRMSTPWVLESFLHSCVVFVAPCVPIVLPLFLLLWVSLVVITIISYVDVFGKDFPVDSSPYVYLISRLARVS